MNPELKILIVEDSEEDTLLLIHKIKRGGFEVMWKRVDNEADMRQSLLENKWDLIISDFSMPNFDGLQALKLYQQISADIPFIIVSGRVGEDVAVNAMKKGAHDYLMKDHLERLVPAIERELGEAQNRRERLKAMKLLKEREEFLSAVIENIPHVIIVKDAKNLRYLRVNKAGEELLGISRDKLIGKSDYDFHHLKEAALLALKDKDVLGRGELVDIPEETIMTKGKGKRILHTKKIPIMNEKGEPLFLCSISDDITARKRQEAQEVELRNQLRQAQKMESLGTLAGGIAHDFNNVLAVIIGYTDLAKDSVTKGGTVEANLEKVLIAANRAKSLVRQILTFSRRNEAEFIPVELREIVEEVLKLLRPSIPSSIEIIDRLESGVIMADPIQIHQVVMNLCTNAYHAMIEDGGTIEITLARIEIDPQLASVYPELENGPAMKLVIRDTGHGMTEDIMARIFDPYFTTKSKGHGTGLGLAVVHSIVKGHHGTITIDSQPDKGALFSIYFPRVNAEATLKEAAATGQSQTGNESILFVDDEPAVTDVCEKILTNLGYSVVAQTDSTQALDLFLAQPDRFDLVITDMAMPKMTGSKLSRKIFEVRPDVPIILCSGFNETITEEKALEIGIQAFLLKPFTQKRLAGVVRRLLDRKKDADQSPRAPADDDAGME
jgi:PAS domain S-box-containing protein